ncbi:MAG: hypothetical protein JF592_11885 [Microbacterium sp.]|nr:LuxR C-terminal-related transcriptional regulator [Microbacterium sp.]MBW8763268.1 hypothetical protein [Microbacterium sp.]
MTGLVYAPVIVAGKVVGTLNLGRAADAASFTPAELQDAGELAALLGSIIAGLWQRSSIERELSLMRTALDLMTEAVVISDVQQASRYSNRAARSVLVALPPDGPSLDEALMEMQMRDRTHDDGDGLVQRTVAVGTEDAFVAFLRSGTRSDELPEWLHTLLTPRELEVVGLAVKGLRDAEIATRLNLSVHTVKGYLREVFKKTGARSRVELARIAADTTQA